MFSKLNGINGDGNLQISGDNNVVNQINADGPLSLTKSQIYDLLVRFTEGTQEKAEDENASDPAPITEKLSFNRAHKHNVLLREQVANYELLDEILASVPNSGLIVNSLRLIYLDSVKFDQSNGEIIIDNGDDNLDRVREEVTRRILEHSGRDIDAHSYEQIEVFVSAFMLYGVWKCKLLENPYSSNSDGSRE